MSLLVAGVAAFLAQAAAPAPVFVAFGGKGDALPWDVGVLAALGERLHGSSLAAVSGSSSGAILAAHVSCVGFERDAVEQAVTTAAASFTPVLGKALPHAIRVALGVPDLREPVTREGIARAAAPDGCVPGVPVLIPAANADVVGQYTTILPRLLDPVRVGADGGVTRWGRPSGRRSCTYFVSPSIAARLGNAGRCELRLVRDVSDLRRAVAASISEPTYFAPLHDDSGHRYAGGHAMALPVKDVLRAVPDALAIGTGRPHFAANEEWYVRQVHRVSMNEIIAAERSSLHMDVAPPASIWRATQRGRLAGTELALAGYLQAERCLSRGCPPTDLGFGPE